MRRTSYIHKSVTSSEPKECRSPFIMREYVVAWFKSVTKFPYFVTKTTSQWENYNVTVACVTGRKLTRGEWPLQLDGFVGRWHTINANKQDTFWIRTHFVYDKCNRKHIPDKFYDHSSNPTSSKDQTISSWNLDQSLNIYSFVLVQ